MKKKIFTLLTLLLCVCSGAWADDVVTATQTFTNERATCTWNPISATVAKKNTAGGDGLYFTASDSKAISTSSGTVQGGTGAIAVVYVQVVSSTSAGTITMTSSSDDSNRILLLNTYNETTNPNAKVSCAKSGSSATFTASDVVSYAGGYYVRLTSTGDKDIKIKTFKIDLANGEKYPESVAVDPVFSLTSSTISTSVTSQIRVGSKGDLDGIKLNSITYGTSGVVTVDEDGVVTPVAAGTTTINFNSGEVVSKYNSSTGNSVTITVIEAKTVFDATGFNTEFILSKANIIDPANEFVSSSTQDWSSRTPTGYTTTDYYNLNGTSRYITFKVSGASTFQIIIQNGSGSANRRYTVKIGDSEAENITAPLNSTTTSKVFATGTTDEVTIIIGGTSDGSLYPAAIMFNPSVSKEITAAGYATIYSDKALDFTGTGITAYKAVVAGDNVSFEEVTSAPAETGLLLKGEAKAYNIPVTATPASVTSALEGTLTETTVPTGTFVLFKKGEKVGFYKTAAEFTVGANTAWLPADVTLSRNFIGFDDETTGIEAVNVTENTNVAREYYNLNGQRVANPTKGLYIVNGKKVIINK